PHALVELAEALGAAAFAFLGVAALLAGAGFLGNFLALGPREPSVVSGGTIPLLGLATGLAVAGGFVLILEEFLAEALERRSRPRRSA
ncbi:MAG TPA: sodium:proton antiporter, partial [Planctomycetota bacterium]|nr:sodium:proton antiporter [Planctomycetota bacterium]